MVYHKILVRLNRSRRTTFYLLLSLVSLPVWIILTQLYIRPGLMARMNTLVLRQVERLKLSMSTACPNQSFIEPPNCTLLFRGDQNETSRISSCWKEQHWTVPTDEQFFSVSSCDWIKKGFDKEHYISEEEKNFPLAFALNVYNSPQQIFRFLQVIYRPHNMYCIHYDQKSEESFKKVMRSLADCLPNVIIPSKTESVIRSWHTVVDAQMNCMSDLNKLRDRYPWRYVITLCGKEVPLKTNREMVQTLKKLNGTSAVQLVGFNEHERTYYWKYKSILTDSGEVTLTDIALGPVPFNISMAKSYAYYGLSATFVDFVLHNNRAKALRKFTEDTILPEEHFVASLFSMTGVPGGKDERYTKYRPEIISCIWLGEDETDKCSGEIVHNLCIIGSADLHRISWLFKYDPNANHQVFFFNKFFLERDRVVMDCAEQELLRRNREEYYRDVDSVKAVARIVS